MDNIVIAYRRGFLKRGVWVSALLVGLVVAYFWLQAGALSDWSGRLMALLGIWFAARLGIATRKLMNPPEVSIGPEGIADGSWNAVRVPWDAVARISLSRRPAKWGEGIFLDVDGTRLPRGKLPISLRISAAIAAWFDPSRGDRLILPLTPVMALEATMDEIVTAIEAHTGPRGIEIMDVNQQAGTTA